MKKTLFITLDFPPAVGGVANYWANLIRHLDNVFVIAPDHADDLIYDLSHDYVICRTQLLSKKAYVWPRWLPLLWIMFDLVRSLKFERVLVTQILPAGTAAWLVKMILRVPYVVSLHGLDLRMAQKNARKRWLAKKILHNAESVIVNSEFTKQLAVDAGCPIEKITIVYPCPNIVYTELPMEAVEQFKSKYNLVEKKIILTVGRLVERKGHDRVIEAMPIVLKKIPNAVYVIVGSGVYENKLREAVEKFGVKDKVLFVTDAVDNDLPMFYQACDVFAMPCREIATKDVEGFGTVYLEANLFGRPVVAGKSGGAGEAVLDGQTGIVVDPNDTSAIAEALVGLLTDEQRAKVLGEAGKKRVIEQFDWKKQAEKVSCLLQ